ncbi:hypothetical protein Tco_1392506 [Tanacetum coccineum]
MAEMFGLLKELTSSRTPKKVLVREEARHSITKNVNAIFIIKMENEKGAKGVKVAERNVMKLKELDVLGPIESVDKGEGTDSRTVKDMQEEITKGETKAEVLLEIPRSRHIGYYLKHEINKKLIEGLVDNHKYNDSFLTTRLGKKYNEAHDYVPKGPLYNVILKEKLVKKDDIEGNFVIPCSIGGVKYVNALINQSSDVKVMPMSSYNRLTSEEPAGTDVTLSFSSQSYIYPLGIVEDVLIDIAGIKLHQEKEMEFNQQRSKVFTDERSTLVNEGCEVIFDEKKLWSS